MDLVSAFLAITACFGIVSAVMWLLGSPIAWGFFKYGSIAGGVLCVAAGISKIVSDTRDARQWQEIQDLSHRVALALRPGEERVASAEQPDGISGPMLSEAAQRDWIRLVELLTRDQERKSTYRLRREDASWELSFRPPASDEFMVWVRGNFDGHS